MKWPSISKKLEQLVILRDDIVHYNDVKDFVPYLQNSNLSDGKLENLDNCFFCEKNLYDMIDNIENVYII